jgi:hypothetical protein
LGLNGPGHLSPIDVLALWARAGPGWAGPFDSSIYIYIYIYISGFALTSWWIRMFEK